MKEYTHVRVRTADCVRINKLVEYYNSQTRFGKYAQPEVVTLALDALQVNINKKNGISTAVTEETPKN